jgi:membrane protein
MKSSGDSKEKFSYRHLPSMIKDAVISWNKDDPWRLSAIIAYYAILSLPGLLVIIIQLLSYIWGAEIVEGRIHGEIQPQWERVPPTRSSPFSRVPGPMNNH